MKKYKLCVFRKHKIKQSSSNKNINSDLDIIKIIHPDLVFDPNQKNTVSEVLTEISENIEK